MEMPTNQREHFEMLNLLEALLIANPETGTEENAKLEHLVEILNEYETIHYPITPIDTGTSTV